MNLLLSFCTLRVTVVCGGSVFWCCVLLPFSGDVEATLGVFSKKKVTAFVYFEYFDYV